MKNAKEKKLKEEFIELRLLRLRVERTSTERLHITQCVRNVMHANSNKIVVIASDQKTQHATKPYEQITKYYGRLQGKIVKY